MEQEKIARLNALARKAKSEEGLTPEEMVSSFHVVDWIEADDTAPKQLTARFTTPAGEPRLIPA